MIGRLRAPLLTAVGVEREGYVPNVVYSCGSLIHGPDLILPYAMSDKASAIATVPLKSLLKLLLSSPTKQTPKIHFHLRDESGNRLVS